MSGFGPGGALRPRVGLAVAHPGHELRLTRWIELQQPSVFIFTSGSRNGADRRRVEASRRLVAGCGAHDGGLFGDHLDRDVYAWILAGDAGRFVGLARRLAARIVDERLEAVVTDAWQLYNVTHDLWHLVTRAAVALAGERLGRRVRCLDYAVVPRSLAQRSLGQAQHAITLTDAELRRKLELARGYPAIAGDLAEVLAAGGEDFLATESLHQPRPLAELLPGPGEVPAYERFGEMRVKAGLYGSVLRWSHAEPIAAALIHLLGEREAAA